MKRIISIMLALAAVLSVLNAAVYADDERPAGWWPVLDAYNQAVSSGKADTIIKAGDDLIKVYTTIPLNNFTANQLYMVYYKRMQLGIYEEKANYAAALDNTKKLLEMSSFLTANGVDRNDMILSCRAHMNALAVGAGVYALSYKESASSAPAAPARGTYYGATSGSDALAYRGITSFYTELEEQSVKESSYLIAPFADGSRALLINWNFKGEGDTARAIPGGKYDVLIEDSLLYIASLDCPTLIRIGGEMNVWENKATPAEYKKAYGYVAAKARELCPDAALVWSPNYVSSWGVQTQDFYPDEKYVDWVGVSLYYKYSEPESITSGVEYFHQGRFADPVVCARETVAIARSHKKPVIVTESGSPHNTGNAAQESFAKEKIAKEFSTLNMVFPEIKAIVYFDRKQGSNDYTLSGDVWTAAESAIKQNRSLAASTEAEAGTWVPLGTVSENAGDALLIGSSGYTYKSAEMSAVYKLDDNKYGSAKGSPNYCKLDLKKLSSGSHVFEVSLSDGAGTTVTLKYRLKYDGKTVAFYGPGDVNCDNKVNAKDVTSIMKALTGSKVTYDKVTADVNCDGKVNAKDVTAIMKSVVGAS